MNLRSFSDFREQTLHEASVPGKNTHLTHLEDLILDEGPAGATFALKVLRAFGKMLDGGKVSRALNVSVKWDGAPALVFGPDPADGKFFVATKSAFAKTPKLAKSHADIDTMYSGGVAPILHLALDELATLQPKVVLQGDVLFTRSTLSQQTIDNVSYYTFQPNTILYAVQQDSALGQQIARAQFGIVIHTMYTGRGSSLAGYTSTPVSPTVFSSLKHTPRVLVLDAAYDDMSGTATFTASESRDFELALQAVTSAAKLPAAIYDVVMTEPIHGILQRFINQQVRNNRRLKPAESVREFLAYLVELMDKEVAARKTPQAQEQYRQKYQSLIDVVTRHRRPLEQWFALHDAIQRAKNIVVQKLGQASRIATFVRTDDGFRVTGPEGFVAVARSGKAVKLVDRLEFSRLNFTAAKNWQ